MFVPTIRQRRLAAELRRLREERDVTLDDAAAASGKSKSTISRMENGQVGVSAAVVANLLGLYEISGERLEYWLTIAREARRRGWWKRYDDVLPDWLEPYLSFETDASAIRDYELRYVPGLLQTPEYARALLRSHPTPLTEEEIQRQVEFRMSRQKVLKQPDAPQYWVVLDESVVRRVVGDRDVMKEQLDELQRAMDRPNITIQVVPARAGAHAALDGSFTVMEFPEEGDPKIVHVEHLTGSLYLDTPREIGRYTLAFEHVRAKCQSMQATRDLLGSVAGET